MLRFTCTGEGVGLEMLEASTIGNPVLTTKYGGQMEYLKNGYFVNYKLDFIKINYSFLIKCNFGHIKLQTCISIIKIYL